MRPRSIAGPLILIAAGALFLIANWKPAFSPLEFLSVYWPYLLIGWGVVRLVEITLWFGRDRAVPRQGISGGEWALIVLLAVGGTVLYVVHTQSPFERFASLTMRGLEMFGEPHRYDLAPKSIEAGTAPRVLIENFRGDVRITGADTTEVTVRGQKEIRALEESEADRTDEATPLELTRTDNQIVVRTNQERATGNLRISEDLEITVPRGSSVDIRSRSGRSEVAGVDGSVEITSDKIEADLSRIQGDIRVESRSSETISIRNAGGSVSIGGRGEDLVLENVAGQVVIDGAYSGDIYLRAIAKPVRFKSNRTEFEVAAVPGEISLDLGDFVGSGLEGPFRLNSRSKDVEISNLTGQATVEVDNGDVSMQVHAGRSGLEPLRIDVRSGNVDLGLPEGAFPVSLATRRGSIENELNGQFEQTTENKGARLIRSGQGAKVEVTVDRGDINLVPASRMPGRTPPKPRLDEPPRLPKLPPLRPPGETAPPEPPAPPEVPAKA